MADDIPSFLRGFVSKAGRIVVSVALASSCCMPSLAFAATDVGGSPTASVENMGALAAASVQPQAASMFEGDLADANRGTEANPYRISTEADLTSLAAAVNGGDALAGKFIALQNDIELGDDSPWTPIGNESTSFGGTFDGCGHTVSNFHAITDEAKYVGFFGAVSPAKSSSPAVAIKNLRVVGKHVADGTDDVDVHGDRSNYQVITGGLVGWVGTRSVSIANCVVDVNVQGVWRVGGIVGGSSNGGTALSISNCLSAGNVYGYDGGGSISAYIGGIAGDWPVLTYASMANCLYLGQVIPSTGALETTNNTWRLTSNALIGRVGGTSQRTVPDSLQNGNWHIAQSIDTVKAMRPGYAESVQQVEGNVVPALTEDVAASIAKDVNGGQDPQVWQLLDGIVPVPAPFGESVEYPPTIHSVTFQTNGGTWRQGVEAGLPTLFAEDGEARELPDSSGISRPGFNFKGWYLSSDFSGDAVTSVPTSSTEDLVFYAKWARIVTVTFDAGAGTLADESAQTLEAGEKITRPADPVPPQGKGFIGWYVEGSAGSSPAWDFEADTPNDDLTLVARYRGETVQVVFDPNGGTLGAGTTSPVEVEKGTPVSKPAKDPTRDGYTFAGWQLGGGAYNFSYAVNLPTTLVAAWTKNPPAAPKLEKADASYSLDDVQYTVGEEPVELRVVASLPGSSAGSLSYQWYRSESAAQDPASDRRLGTGEACLPDVSAIGTWYYYCVVTNTLDGDASSVSSTSAKIQVVAPGAALEDTFPVDLDAPDEVILSTRADFEAFRDAVNSGKLYDKTVKLAHDVDLGGTQSNQWEPIGKISSFKSGKPNAAMGFTGTFDGRGHTVSGLFIDASAGGQALFAYLPAGSTVRNLVVKGSVTASGSCVAGVVGAAPRSNDEVVIQNVGNEVDVTSTAMSDYVYAGGVVGFAEYAKTEISGCYNAGSITTNRSTAYAGGIVGWNATVRDCYNVGAITANSSNSNTYVGGIVGQVSGSAGSLVRCYNNAEVTLAGSGTYGGAIAGSISASAVTSCFYNSSKAVRYGSDAGIGGTASVTGAVPYESADALLEALAAAAPSTWKSGATVNVEHEGTPALAWQSSDAQTYAIATAEAQHGGYSVSHSVAAAGMRVTVEAFPDAGYVLDAVTVTDATGNPVAVNGMAFVMPGSDVTVQVAFKEAPPVLYKVIAAATENGSFTTDADEAIVNATVTVSVAPDEGYEVAAVSVVDAQGHEVTVNGATFVMPESDVTVTVAFKQCSYMDARITVNPVSGEAVAEDLPLVLVDKAPGALRRPTGSLASGNARIFTFSAVEGHTYSIEVDSDLYELDQPADVYMNPMQGGVMTRSVQLKYRDVKHTVTFDPGPGAFPAGSDADLAEGKVVRVVAGGQIVSAPAVPPERVGFAFAGWYSGDQRFLPFSPVTADATYTARWQDPGQETSDTFLADLGGARDGSAAAPYRVTTEQDLRDLALVVNGAEVRDGAWADTGAAHTFAGSFVSLEADIALADAFTPIGIGSAAPSGAYRARPFGGTFLGNNHVISGLTVTDGSNPAFTGSSIADSALVTHHGEGAYSALFGSVAGATIQDLTVVLAGGGLAAAAPASGLVAHVGAGQTRIGHCAVEGDVAAQQGAIGANVAGGLVALFEPVGGSGTLRVEHCYHAGAVSGTGIAGGLIGAVGASGAQVSASYHVGAVSTSSQTASCASFIGGATADGASSAVSACATDLADTVGAVGGSAASYARVSGVLFGVSGSDWAAGDGASGARAALGTDYFDFEDVRADRSPKLRGDVVWQDESAPGPEEPAVYSVTFVDEDGTTVLKEATEYAEGTAAADIARPQDPAKASTAKFDYAFAGWTPEVSDVTADATYTATYEAKKRSYTVAFKNGDEVLQSSQVEYGATPAYSGAMPVKASTAQYSFAFAGWSAALQPVTGDAVYSAEFTQTVCSYKITWKNGSTVLATTTLAYGATPAYPGKAPVKAADASNTYAFSGWSPAVGKVTGAATYTAQFKATARISIAKAKVTLKKASAAYTGAVQKGAVAKVTLSGKVLAAGVDYKVTSTASGKNVGSYKVTVTGIGAYKGTASAAFKVTPAANKITAKAARKTLKGKKSGKTVALAKANTLKLSTVLKASAKTPLKFAKANKAGGAKITVTSAGTLTARKGLKAGTYNVKVKLTAPAKGNYAAATAKAVTLKILIK